MSPLSCLVLPHEDADGPANMARDEALLELVSGSQDAAAFRTYGWTAATLSLGYFQPIARAESDPRWQGVPLVRRPTGGGAICHDREVTYALGVPRGHPLARRSEDLYRAVHAAVAGLLAASGIDARRRGVVEQTPAGVERPFLCFSDRDADDVVAGTVKLVGSAQRRRSGAVLQHGSILLARSPLAPELPGVSDLSPYPAHVEEWVGRLRRLFPEALGFSAVASPWPEELRSRARELEASVYRDPKWTRKR